MRNIFISGMLIVTTAFTGCSKKEPAATDNTNVESIDAKYAKTLVGQWKAVKPVTETEAGVTVIMSNLSSVYFSNGTSSWSGDMEIIANGIPDNLKKFRIKTDATWQITDSALRENITKLSISPHVVSPTGLLTGKAMAKQMKSAPTTHSQIISLDKDRLILKERESGITIEYRRQ
jgi:hypothetical protein